MSLAKPFLVVLVLIIYISACISPQKLVEHKKYDKAILQIAKKFKKNSNRPADLVKLLEESYIEVMGNDLTAIKDLKEEFNAENWDEIAAIYDKIDRRQQLLAPLLPIVSDDKQEAHIVLIDVTAKKEEAQQEATKFHYYRGIALLDSANNSNNRFMARDAHQHFLQAQQYLSNYDNQDLGEYINAAKDLGTTYVFIQWKNRWSINIADEFYINAISYLENNTWIAFYTKPLDDFEPHYTLNLESTLHKVSDNEYDSYHTRDVREVMDGVETVYDNNGNVMTDEDGNTITRPKMISVTCNVQEIRQYKYVKIITLFKLEDNQQNRIVHDEDLKVTYEFDNRFILYNGDRRALSDQHQEMLGNSREIYPDEDEMTMLAAEQMRSLVKDVWDEQADQVQ